MMVVNEISSVYTAHKTLEDLTCNVFVFQLPKFYDFVAVFFQFNFFMSRRVKVIAFYRFYSISIYITYIYINTASDVRHTVIQC